MLFGPIQTLFNLLVQGRIVQLNQAITYALISRTIIAHYEDEDIGQIRCDQTLKTEKRTNTQCCKMGVHVPFFVDIPHHM